MRAIFTGRGLFSDFDFAAMREGKPDALFTAWLALPDAPRHAMDAGLDAGQGVHDTHALAFLLVEI